MIILGIDPGLAAMGWGVIKKLKVKSAKLKVGNSDGWEVVDYGDIRTLAGEAEAVRLSQIHQGVLKLLKKFEPDVVVIEELFFGANAKTAIKVGEARGAILLACGFRKIPTEEYTPLQIKTALTGYGRAEKSQVQSMVQRLLNLKELPKPDHAADAIGCAYCHAVSMRMTK